MYSCRSNRCICAGTCRKDELVVGFQSVAGAQNLLAKYPRETVQDNMLKYVLEGRAAMGPSFLKVRALLLPLLLLLL